MDFDFEDLESEEPAEFVEAGKADTKEVEDIIKPVQPAVVPQVVDPEVNMLLAKDAARAVQGIIKRFHFLKEQSSTIHAWCRARFTADRWLDENERDWYALDRMCRSRPWATRKDEPFAYPFRATTDAMRKLEGKWVGDDQPRVKDTRGKAPCDVLTNMFQPAEYPPQHRVVLFAPEFGSDQAFTVDPFKKMAPEEEVDLWALCWVGWSDFSTMIAEVTQKILSFGDGVNTVLVGQGMGALVAYEVLKHIEKTEVESPNLPVALVVADCPAPHLFAEAYRPYEKQGWTSSFASQSAEVQGRVTGCVSMMKSYRFVHPKSQAVLPVAVTALYHSGESLASEEAVKAWERYAAEGTFEVAELGQAREFKGYVEGKGYGLEPAPKMLAAISTAYSKHDRWLKDGVMPDIGPTDGPMAAEVDCVIVGAGISGVYQGGVLAEGGKSVLILDRYHLIGGVWQFYGNDYSRVNTSEVGYRILARSGTWRRPNEDHSPRRDILRDIYSIAAEHCYGMVRCNIDVQKVDKLPDGSYDVYVRNVKDGKEHKIHAGAVSFNVNRRIGKKREVDWPGSENFKGQSCYGYGNEVRGLKFWDKKVLIIGAGAFAFENVRTALEHGAKHVTLMGRRDGTTCPKWIDMIAFLRPLDHQLMVNKTANMVSFDIWQKCYVDAGLRTPKCWDDGLLKPNNHTISVSDLAFIAGYHGMFKLQVGEIHHYRPDGTGVVLKDGGEIDCDMIIKCCGFHLNEDVPKVTGYQKMQPYGLLDFNLNYNAEPLLDGGQFGSGKDKTEVNADYGFSEADFHKGISVFRRLGMDETCLQPMGNPFGSGQGGPIVFQSKYFLYLLDHPEEQAALLKHGGDAPQDVVNLWASQLGQYSHIVMLRLVASLSSLHA